MNPIGSVYNMYPYIWLNPIVNLNFAVFHGSVMGTESSFNNKQFAAVLDESPF